MNIMMFLGSGVSFASGLPDVNSLTSSILNNSWFDHTDNNFYPGKHPGGSFWEKNNIVPRLQSFLTILKNHADKYFKDRRNVDANYEDIYYICQQIHDELSGEIDNPAISNFVIELEKKVSHLYEPLPNRKEFKFNLNYLALRSCELIQCAVWSLLHPSDAPKGLDLITDLVNHSKSLKINIATLNHDLLVEDLLESAKLPFIDGFGAPDGEIRYFDPNLYNTENHRIKIYKLHGSINWYRFREEVKVDNKDITYDRYGILLNADIWHAKKSDGSFVNILEGKPIFLTGSYNKMLDYQFGIVKLIHSRFEEQLSRHNIVIMSGYGWNDRGINGRLFEWINSSLDKRLILLHRSPETEIKVKSKSAMWHRYDNLVNDGRLIPIKKWMSETSLKDIIPLI